MVKTDLLTIRLNPLDNVVVARVELSAGTEVPEAPLLSTPKEGKDWEYLPSKKVELARIFEATTVPWPPRP